MKAVLRVLAYFVLFALTVTVCVYLHVPVLLGLFILVVLGGVIEKVITSQRPD